MPDRLRNYVAGEWGDPPAAEYIDVINPATAGVLAAVPMTPPAAVAQAVAAAADAHPEWRRTPPTDRVQHLFRFRALLEDHVEEVGRIVTEECGKTFEESVAEMRRAIENVEVACGIPSLMQGYNNEDIASGIDEHMLRQPLGVCACIAPFNFPAMVPFWFMPYALACGNCFVLKPSEKTPMASQRA